MGSTRETERPFRDILTELTFEANAEGLDPFDAYVRMREKMGRLDVQAEDYCSSSITSGGHVRDDSLDIGQAIAKNTDTAMELCDELFRTGQLNPTTAIEAVVLGKIAWRQSDYMSFWLATMTGLPARGYGVHTAMGRFRADLQTAIADAEDLDMDTYDAKLPAAIRAPHYFKHAEVFAATARRHVPNPIRRLVRLIDPDMSLGAQTENVYARLMHTGVFRVAIAETGIEPDEHMLPAHLVQDTRRLVRFGATVFDTLKRQQLVLVPQESD